MDQKAITVSPTDVERTNNAPSAEFPSYRADSEPNHGVNADGFIDRSRPSAQFDPYTGERLPSSQSEGAYEGTLVARAIPPSDAERRAGVTEGSPRPFEQNTPQTDVRPSQQQLAAGQPIREAPRDDFTDSPGLMPSVPDGSDLETRLIGVEGKIEFFEHVMAKYFRNDWDEYQREIKSRELQGNLV